MAPSADSDTQTQPMITVRFDGMADKTNMTGAISLNDRAPINLGESGEITLKEMATLQGAGAILIPVDSDGNDLTSEAPKPSASTTSTIKSSATS